MMNSKTIALVLFAVGGLIGTQLFFPADPEVAESTKQRELIEQVQKRDGEAAEAQVKTNQAASQIKKAEEKKIAEDLEMITIKLSSERNRIERERKIATNDLIVKYSGSLMVGAKIKEQYEIDQSAASQQVEAAKEALAEANQLIEKSGTTPSTNEAINKRESIEAMVLEEDTKLNTLVSDRRLAIAKEIKASNEYYVNSMYDIEQRRLASEQKSREIITDSYSKQFKGVSGR
jgi:hypothetical protein